MSASNRLRLRLFPRAEAAVRRGHPWIFEGSIKDQNREGRAGELAVIYDRRDRFLCVGLYDPDSPIRVRVVHLGKPATIDADWWRARAVCCRDKRRQWFAGEATTGMRLINGENEGFPGLVCDCYGDTLVVKIYTAAWLAQWEEMEAVLREVFTPAHLVLRMSRNIQQQALEEWGMEEGFRGKGGEDPVVFVEDGIRFEAEVCKGQKTGFFLDQRENRLRVAQLAAGREVLNVFSFSGGFSLHAARAGAKSVTDLDISAHALASAARNFELNRDDPRIAGASYLQVRADAFQWMHEERELYDLIIVDPPSLAKRESERERAIAAYERINARAVERLRPDGVLLAASCSAHVSQDQFESLIEQVAVRSGRRWRTLWTSAHAVDHPAVYPEAHYLKAVAVEFG